MSDTADSRSSWVCALWCGVAQRLIRERLAPGHERGPLKPKDRAAIVSSIKAALVGHPYLEEPCAEALALLEAA